MHGVDFCLENIVKFTCMYLQFQKFSGVIALDSVNNERGGTKTRQHVLGAIYLRSLRHCTRVPLMQNSGEATDRATLGTICWPLFHLQDELKYKIIMYYDVRNKRMG